MHALQRTHIQALLVDEKIGSETNDKSNKTQNFTMVVFLTADEFLRHGLMLVGFDVRRQQRVARATNVGRFKTYYGSDPVVYAAIWEDLNTTENLAARISDKAKVDSFLQGIYFLKCYPKEAERAGTFQVCEKTARKWGWYFAQKIQALKEEKVSLLLQTNVNSRPD
jgi:hypothetical protein